MSTMTLPFDFAGMAIEKIQHVARVDKNAARNVELTKQAASFIPVFMSSWIGRIFAQYLNKKSQSLILDAIFLEGAAYKLSAQNIETSTRPRSELVAALDSFMPTLLEAIASCEHAGKFFYARNSGSPTARAFEKVALALEQVQSAAAILRAVAAGSSIPGVLMPFSAAQSWEDAVAHQSRAFNAVRSKIRDGDISDIDDDLLEMAAQAIAMSDSRDLQQDQDWVKRMSRSSMH